MASSRAYPGIYIFSKWTDYSFALFSTNILYVKHFPLAKRGVNFSIQWQANLNHLPNVWFNPFESLRFVFHYISFVTLWVESVGNLIFPQAIAIHDQRSSSYITVHVNATWLQHHARRVFPFARNIPKSI